MIKNSEHTEVILKLISNVKSTDDFQLEYIKDTIGNMYDGDGLSITIKVDGKEYSWDFALWPFTDDYDNWDEAKNYIKDLIYESTDFSEYMKTYYNLEETDTIYQTIKEQMIKAGQYLASQVESGATAININDLNEYWMEDEDDE